MVEALCTVAHAIPDGVTGIFGFKPFGRTMALGSTQPLNTKEYQDYLLGVKATGAFGRQPYHLQVPIA